MRRGYAARASFCVVVAHVGLSATSGRDSAQTQMNGAQFTMHGAAPVSGALFGTSVNGGTVSRLTLSAKQPLYSFECLAQIGQCGFAVWTESTS